MNSNLKYTSLSHYAVALSNSFHNFDSIFWGRPPKQMGSFIVTLSNIESIMDNIKEIQNMQSQMKGLATLDSEALNNNRSARKVSDKISSIKTDLIQSYARLKDEFFRQMEIASKQCREVSRAITDKEERARFSAGSRDFEVMAYEAKTEGHKIPFGERKKIEQHKIDQTKREHSKEEEQIDRIYESESLGVDKLEEALKTLTIILSSTRGDRLQSDVRSEVAQIKKVLSPKVISVTKEGLEALKHSSHLLLDLEQIAEILKTSYRFMGKDGKLQKINKELDSLMPLLEHAIREERNKESKMVQDQKDVEAKIYFATDAVRTYGKILSDNARLEKEQSEIRDNNHGLYAENDRLLREQEAYYSAAEDIQKKPVSRQELDDEVRIDEFYRKAKESGDAIKENEKYMKDKLTEQVILTLPVEYTNMKRKLQSMSSLYDMQMIESQDLTQGGVSR